MDGAPQWRSPTHAVNGSSRTGPNLITGGQSPKSSPRKGLVRHPLQPEMINGSSDGAERTPCAPPCDAVWRRVRHAPCAAPCGAVCAMRRVHRRAAPCDRSAVCAAVCPAVWFFPSPKAVSYI
eukprot:gene11978-biopygen2059